MRDSRLNEAERGKQPAFIFKLLFSWLFAAFLLALLHGDPRDLSPDREPSPDQQVLVRYAAINLGEWRGPSGWRLTGAWEVTSPSPRLAGLSALLHAEGDELIGLTDSGVLVTLSGRGRSGPALFRDLPAGPGNPHYRRNRDSEAALWHGGRLLVTYETHHSLWSFNGEASLLRSLSAQGWSRNAGVEAMVIARDGLLLFPEHRDSVLHLAPGGRLSKRPLQGRTGGITDATTMPDGRILVAVREVGMTGIRNRLAWLEASEPGYRLGPFATLPLGPFDNVEGLAAKALAGGRAILWAVTDNDGWRRTLLLRMEIDATKAPAQAEAFVKPE